MGAQLRVYRQKIKSAQTTKKITRAMELIAASRIQKAKARMAASGPYSRAVTRAVSAVATFSNVDHLLTTEPEKVERAAIVDLLLRPRPCRRVQHERAPRGRGAHDAAAQPGQGRRLLPGRAQGRRLLQLPQARGRAALGRRNGQPGFGTAKEIGDALVAAFVAAGGRGRRRRDPHRLQPLREHAHPDAGGRAPAAARGCRRCRGARRRTSMLPLTSSSPRSTMCSTRCCRSTSRAASSTRCCSRRPQSTRQRRRR